MSIFRYLVSHNRSDYGHHDHNRKSHDSRHHAGPNDPRELPSGSVKQCCLNCQSLQDEEARYCSSCGKSLVLLCRQCQDPLPAPPEGS